jgi:hypothetical protein
MNPYFSMTNAELRDSDDPGAAAELERRRNKRAARSNPLGSTPWQDESGNPVDIGGHSPTHFAYVTVEGEGTDKQYLVAGFGPVARFWDGMVVRLKPRGSTNVKGLDPLEDRVAARMVYKYYVAGSGPASYPPQTR